MKSVVGDDANDTIESEDALYNNEKYCESTLPSGKKNTKYTKRRRIDDDSDCNVIREKDLKNNSLKATVSVSKNDISKNPQPFNINLSPFVYNLIMSVASRKRQDFLETTLEITSSGILEFIQLMDIRYNKMSDIVASVSKYNTMKRSNVEIPHTEIFSEDNYKNVKEKVMVTSAVNSWLHKYKKTFNIEYSDSFSAVIMLVNSNPDYSDEETSVVCKEGLEYFYSHLDEKIEKMSELPSELMSSLLRCLDYLSAIGVKEKTIYLNPSSGKANVKFTVECGNHEEGYYKYEKNRTTSGIFSKK